jgi:hypothetical protein
VSAPRDPWSDPATPTEQGPAYAGPPPTMPPPTMPPPYGWPGPAPYGYGPPGFPPPYGYGPHPPYGPPGPYGAVPYPGGPFPPAREGRPGQVVGAAVLGFVQALLVLIASMYVWFIASMAELAIEGSPNAAPAPAYEFAREGPVLTIVQLVSAALLVIAGILALTRRTRMAWLLLVAALAAQIALAIYWWVQLADLLGPVAAAEDVGGVLGALSLFFAAAPLVALGLILFGRGRRWFTAPPG